MTKEPNKDFMTSLLEVLECRDCRMYKTPCGFCLNQAGRILALCKEMLVPRVDLQFGCDDEPNYTNGFVNGFESACQHLLKQLGEDAK